MSEEITFELIVKSGKQEAKVTVYCQTQEEADYLGEQLALAVVAYKNKYHPDADPSKYVLNIGKETTYGYFSAKPEQPA